MLDFRPMQRQLVRSDMKARLDDARRYLFRLSYASSIERPLLERNLRHSLASARFHWSHLKSL